MVSTILRLLQPLQHWLGWSWVVLVVQRDDEVLVSALPRECRWRCGSTATRR